METTRRSVLRLAAGAGLAAMTGQRALAQGTGVASGGIGLTREQLEARYGTGVDAESLTVFEGVTVGVPGTTLYAQFRGDIVEHLEVRWSMATQVGGVGWDVGYLAAMDLLPTDAAYRDQYWMPATPEGPTELIAHVYESPALNAAQYNLGRILVLFQRQMKQLNANAPLEPVIPAVTLTMAEVGQ